MKRRALVFDDDETILGLLTSILEIRDYDVQTYSNPTHAPLFTETGHLCSLDNTCADLIISDVNMPGMTGLELIEHLRSQGCSVKHFALMSGYWSKAHRQQAEKLGCKIFQKPFRVSDILHWLDEFDRKSYLQSKPLNLSRAG